MSWKVVQSIDPECRTKSERKTPETQRIEVERIKDTCKQSFRTGEERPRGRHNIQKDGVQLPAINPGCQC